MKHFKLPEDVILEIAQFLNLKEILVTFQLLNKKIMKTIKENTILFKYVFKYQKGHFLLNEISKITYSEQLYILKNIYKTTDILPVAAFFTDGGIYSSSYNISNIFASLEGPLYSSTKKDNTNVEFVVSQQAKNLISYSDLNGAKVKEVNGHKHYNFKHKQYLSPSFPYEFSIINRFTISNKISSYTCFIEKFMLFVSLEEINDEAPIIKAFEKALKVDFLHANKIATSLTKSGQSNLYEINLNSWIRSNIFSEISNKSTPEQMQIFPLLYFDIVHSYNNFHIINIKQKVPFRYMLLKLLDAHKSSDSNIDCFRCEARGIIIKLLLSNED